MENSLYLDILAAAEKNGIGLKTDVTPCFDNHSLEAENIFALMVDSRGRQQEIAEYLNRMEKSGHLLNSDIKVLKRIDETVKKWNNYEFAISVILSPGGYKFLQEVNLNNSILENNRFQKNSQTINTILALITTIFVIMTGYFAYNDNTEKELKEVANQIKELRKSKIN